MAEQVLAGAQKYHKRCFTCNNKPSCNKSLDSGSFNEHGGNSCGLIYYNFLVTKILKMGLNYSINIFIGQNVTHVPPVPPFVK